MVSYRAFSSHGRWHYCRYTTTLCMEWSIPTLLGSWCPQGFAAALRPDPPTGWRLGPVQPVGSGPPAIGSRREGGRAAVRTGSAHEKKSAQYPGGRSGQGCFPSVTTRAFYRQGPFCIKKGWLLTRRVEGADKRKYRGSVSCLDGFSSYLCTT
jgi:hypothetical protein